MTQIEETTVSTASLRPWARPVEDVAKELDTDVEHGLGPAEAARRLDAHGPNALRSAPPVPAWRRFAAQFADPLVLLLLAAIAISIAAWLVEGAGGAPLDAIAISAIVVANAVIGFVQERRAEAAVAALSRMAAPHARVRRGGDDEEIDAVGVVVGDLLLLGEGDAVAADARLVEAVALRSTEAALTGESEPVDKSPIPVDDDAAIADRTSMVFAGTTIAAGRGRAIVTATAMATEHGRIAELLEAAEEEPTPLQREIARLGRILGITVIALAAVIVAAIFLTSDIDGTDQLVDVLFIGVSLAVAAVPEGLPAVLAVVLSIGVQRMARRNAIVKRLASVETLGAASVICSDKTGTLTRNEMRIERVVTADGDVELDDLCDPPTGTDSAPHSEAVAAAIDVVRGGAIANDASLGAPDHPATGDPTEIAFLLAAEQIGMEPNGGGVWRRVGEVPFSSERKLMTVVVDHDHDGRRLVVTKGAPDILLHRCGAELAGGVERSLDPGRRDELLDTVARLAASGLRPLAVATRELAPTASTVASPAASPAASTVASTGGPDEPAADPADGVEADLVFRGVVGIIDPPRPEAGRAVAEATAAGIRVAMITGDHPRTALHIARELGIAGPDDLAVTGPELDGLDDAGFADVARTRPVFARVAPEHKLRLVDTLQADGEIVAMTGDGVNDAPALKSADIGVAMGINGTEVSKAAASMILADDDFATIVAAIREGRGIDANIRKFLRYLLSSNAGEVLTMLFGIVFATALGLDRAGTIAVPLLATHILWINLLTDTGPALALGVDPQVDLVMDRPPRGPHDRVIDGEMAIGIGWVSLVMSIVTLLALDLEMPGGLVTTGDGDLTTARTMAFTTLVVAQLFNALNARSARRSALARPGPDRMMWLAIAVALGLQAAVVHVPWLGDAFETAPLDAIQWLTAIGLGAVVLLAEEARKSVVRARRRDRGPAPSAG